MSSFLQASVSGVLTEQVKYAEFKTTAGSWSKHLLPLQDSVSGDGKEHVKYA